MFFTPPLDVRGGWEGLAFPALHPSRTTLHYSRNGQHQLRMLSSMPFVQHHTPCLHQSRAVHHQAQPPVFSPDSRNPKYRDQHCIAGKTSTRKTACYAPATRRPFPHRSDCAVNLCVCFLKKDRFSESSYSQSLITPPTPLLSIRGGVEGL